MYANSLKKTFLYEIYYFGMNFKRNMLYNRYANVHQISMFSSVLTEVAFFNRMNKNEATVLPHLLLHCGFSLV